MRRAVFLDRDGVLVEDIHLLTHADQLRLLPGVPGGLVRLHEAGFLLVVVSNQPVVARGLCSEADIIRIHAALDDRLVAEGGCRIDRCSFCPHHPDANVPEYRIACDCRKPKPGMLLDAAAELGIDVSASFMIGDRLTDVAAGVAAGCRTVWVQTGRHVDPLIQTEVPIESDLKPDHVCADLPTAVGWILNL